MVPRFCRPYVIVVFLGGDYMEKFIFDIDGTLLKTNWQYEEIYFNSVLSSEDAKLFIPNISRLLADYEKNFSRYDINLLSRYLTESFDVMITPDIIRGWLEAGKNYYEVIPGAKEALDYLKSKDKKIVALSNWFTEMNKTRLERAGLLKYFDAVYCSDLVDMKPSQSSYLMACGDTLPTDTVMIGDSLQLDVMVPLELGMDAIYYCPNENEQVNNPKIKVIRKLNELKEIC